ncbi:MAG TPA: digeranylgeranylglyceryl phosphate synthase [Candidatus Aenigmarchaeota archaeon]|nr:digeranylgeranylglyceryl phosphate synthase [Candidatus Aenigmarchaeota archaeon]
MFGYIEILRPGNCIMSAVAVFIGALLVMGGGNINLLLDFTSSYRIYLAMLVVFMITGAGNAINDYFDVESDRINRPRRPIPSGRVSVHGALLYASALFITGIILSGFINYFCFLIAAINSILLILYSKNLQNKILIGNLVIGYLVGSTFLFGGAAMKNLALPFWLFLLSMFSTISREIVKDIEDMEGDRKSFLKRLTYRIKKGIAERFRLGEGGIELAFEVKRARLLSFMALLTAVVISPSRIS